MGGEGKKGGDGEIKEERWGRRGRVKGKKRMGANQKFIMA